MILAKKVECTGSSVQTEGNGGECDERRRMCRTFLSSIHIFREVDKYAEYFCLL